MEKFGEPKLSEEEKKPREEQKEREKEKKKAEEARRLKNRRINYFVMRYMWQVVRGRSGDDTIYNAFGMSRERYTRILDTGKVRYRKNELEELVHHTGIPRTIFTGEERYTCLNAKGEEIVSPDTWDDFVKCRDAKRTSRDRLNKSMEETGEPNERYVTALNKASEDYKTIQEKVEGLLKEATRKGDTSFHRLCAFLKNGYGIRLERIQDVYSALKYLNFDLLNECHKDELNQLYKELSRRMKLVNAVLTYRGARGDFKRK